MQDTTRQKIFIRQDTVKQVSDSVSHKRSSAEANTLLRGQHGIIGKEVTVPDTISVCSRNSVADVTFYDSTCFVFNIDGSVTDRFPFVFTGINREKHNTERESLIHHLKSGNEIPKNPYRIDWIVSVIIISVFMYGLLKTASVSLFRGLVKFLTFRGINESTSRDLPEIFHWQSTLFNLAAFMNISLFGFLCTVRFNINLTGVGNFLLWLIIFGIVIAAITLRHIICRITGNVSGEPEVFREYLVSIYNSYRIGGFIFLIINILILYTTVIPVNILFIAGIWLAGTLYVLRILRLLLIFIKRHVSILYLILYLCALEFLPVVIIVKYVTGLVV